MSLSRRHLFALLGGAAVAPMLPAAARPECFSVEVYRSSPTYGHSMREDVVNLGATHRWGPWARLSDGRHVKLWSESPSYSVGELVASSATAPYVLIQHAGRTEGDL